MDKKLICPVCGCIKFIEIGRKYQCKGCGLEIEDDIDDSEESIKLISELYDAEGFLQSEPPRFDLAESKFKHILVDFPKCYEAHWGLFKASNDITYINGKPICYSYDKINDDEDDYNNAVKYAPNDLKQRYYDEFNKIKENKKVINKVKADYDVFLSYKEKDDKTNASTADSMRVAELYNYLTKKGIKVFFAPITMKSYVGFQYYDAIIYAALKKSKALILYASNPEYCKAPWVESEWSRFIDFIDKDLKQPNSLIPVIGFQATELPRKLQKIECCDLNSKSLFDDIYNALIPILNIKNTSSVDKIIDYDELRAKRELESQERMRKIEEKQKKNDFLYEERARKRKEQAEIQELKRKNRIQKMEDRAYQAQMRRKEQEAQREELERINELKKFEQQQKEDEIRLKNYYKSQSRKNRQEKLSNIKESASGFIKKHKKLPLIIIGAILGIILIGSILSGIIEGLRQSFSESLNYTYDGDFKYLPYEDNKYYYLAESSSNYKTDYEVNENCKVIKKTAFDDCKDIKNLTIPGTILQIEESTFKKCTTLEKVYFKGDFSNWNSVEFKDREANPMTSATVYLYNSVLSEYYEIDSIKFSETDKYVGNYQYTNFDMITELSLPYDIEKIGDASFYDCNKMVSITLQKKITSIGEYAFYNCNSLETVIFTGTTEEWNLIKIGKYAFDKTKVKRISCTDGIVYI